MDIWTSNSYALGWPLFLVGVIVGERRIGKPELLLLLLVILSEMPILLSLGFWRSFGATTGTVSVLFFVAGYVLGFLTRRRLVRYAAGTAGQSR